MYEERSLVLPGSVSVHEWRVLVCRLLLISWSLLINSHTFLSTDSFFIKGSLARAVGIGIVVQVNKS